MRLFVYAAAAALSLPTVARADATYFYTGQNFTYHTPDSSLNGSDSVTGYLTFANPLADNLVAAPVSPDFFSFSTGPDTINSSSFIPPGRFDRLTLSTGSSGQITSYDIAVFDAEGGIGIADPGGDAASFSSTDQASNTIPGSFSAPVITGVTPEPSSFALLGTGLLGVAGALRKRLAQRRGTESTDKSHSRQLGA